MISASLLFYFDRKTPLPVTDSILLELTTQLPFCIINNQQYRNTVVMWKYRSVLGHMWVEFSQHAFGRWGRYTMS